MALRLPEEHRARLAPWAGKVRRARHPSRMRAPRRRLLRTAAGAVRASRGFGTPRKRSVRLPQSRRLPPHRPRDGDAAPRPRRSPHRAARHGAGALLRCGVRKTDLNSAQSGRALGQASVLVIEWSDECWSTGVNMNPGGTSLRLVIDWSGGVLE